MTKLEQQNTASNIYEEIVSRNKLAISDELFDKISRASVAVIGIGGVGSVVAEQLVRLGVKNITIVARSTYELGNINRQIPATYLSVISRTPKVHAMAQRLYTINPFINLNLINLDVAKNPNILYNELKEQRPEIIFNCVDEYYAQITVAELADQLGIPMIWGGVTRLGWNGIVSVYDPKGKIKYQSIFSSLASILENNNKSGDIDEIIKKYWLTYHKKDMPSWLRRKYAENPNLPYPVITPVPWIIASYEVVEFIKAITHIKDVVLFPKALWLDILNLKVEIIDLRRLDIRDYVPWRP